MAYTINKFDGSVLTTLIDGTLDRTTSVGLVGKNFAGYGEIQNENFVFLLENFARANAPNTPLRGQLWFDTENEKIRVYDSTKFKSLSVTEISDTEPTELLNGEFWWDSKNSQLYGYTGSEFDLIGPEKAGEDTTRFVSRNITDSQDNTQPVVIGVVDGKGVIVISDSEFTIPEGEFEGFTAIKKGITLKNSASGVTDPTEYWFWGTASNANLLDNLNSSQFLRSDQDTALTGNLEFVDDNTGLEFSSASIKQSNNKLEFAQSQGTFEFVETDSNNTVLSIDTTNQTEGIKYFGNQIWHSGYQGANTGLDADTVDGLEAEDFLGVNAKAADSDKLDGIDSTGFLLVDGKADDSDRLDSKNGTYYLDFDNFTNIPNPTITLTGDVSGSVTLTDLASGTLNVSVIDNSHKHVISNITSLQSELNSKFNVSGGVLTGNIEFQDDQEGIVWSRNTDGASIKFYNTSDGDSDSRLEFNTRDNNNEYFLWTHDTTELMRLVPNDVANGLTYRSNTVWHQGNQGAGSGLDADTVDGLQSADFLPVNGKAQNSFSADNALDSDRLNGLTSDVFLRKSGGSLTGFLTLHATPQNDFHAATKKYVEDYVDNEFIPLKFTSGQVSTNGFTDVVGGFRNFRNYFDVFPPAGYSISNLVAFIPSINFIAFDGGVDDNDKIRCEYSILSNRIRVWVQNSEQRATPRGNFLAVWSK